MKIKFFNTDRSPKHYVMIGKTGVVNLKKGFCKDVELGSRKYVLVGIDEEDERQEWLYFIYPEKDNEGAKIYRNHYITNIKLTRVIKELGITTPLNCPYEKIENGFRLKIKNIV